MPDPFRHVRPGEEISFSATAHNAMLDAAEAHRRRVEEGAVRGEGPLANGAVARVRNDSGASLLRGGVLGLGGPVFAPSADLDAFLREVTFSGVTPDSGHAAKFAVLLEPIPDGGFGRAFVAGVCPVLVDVTDADHAFAEAEAGETGMLVSVESGSAQILWKESDGESYGYDTGVMWAVILFGTSCGSGSYY